MRYRVKNVTRNTQLADDAGKADSFGARFMGLMGVTDFPLGKGLHIEPCTSIHTFFMKIPIDAVFLDKNLQVVDVAHAMAPWRMSRVYFGARSVLELPAGTASATHTEAGDHLEFEAMKSTSSG